MNRKEGARRRTFHLRERNGGSVAGMVKVEHWNADVEGALTQEALCRKLEQHGYTTTLYVYPPGTMFPDHVHGVDKIDAVVSGRFRMAMRGKAVVLEAGDCLAVPAGTVHSAEVVGNEPVVSVDAVKRIV
jgi:mannose-6-phosphate isomerase-like protein (cupin superfamily)